MGTEAMNWRVRHLLFTGDRKPRKLCEPLEQENMMIDMRVPVHIANQPRPQPPDCCSWRMEWMYYYHDLACWLAMRSDVLEFGVRKEES